MSPARTRDVRPIIGLVTALVLAALVLGHYHGAQSPSAPIVDFVRDRYTPVESLKGFDVYRYRTEN